MAILARHFTKRVRIWSVNEQKRGQGDNFPENAAKNVTLGRHRDEVPVPRDDPAPHRCKKKKRAEKAERGEGEKIRPACIDKYNRIFCVLPPSKN